MTDEKEKNTKPNEQLNQVMEKLREEKKRFERDVRHEYRNARKYVRSHPEQGLTAAFFGGVLAGIILTKLFSSK